MSRNQLVTGRRNSDAARHLDIHCQKGAAIRRERLGNDHRNRIEVRTLFALLMRVTVQLLATCVLLASVTSVVRQITSPRLVDMRMLCRALYVVKRATKANIIRKGTR